LALKGNKTAKETIKGPVHTARVNKYPYNKLRFVPLRISSWKSDWLRLRQECRTLSDWGERVLSSGLRESARGVVIEPYYVCKDYRNLFSNYYSKKAIETSSYAKRLHFFSTDDIAVDKLKVSPEQFRDQYIGYATVRPVWGRSIGRSVFDPLLLNRFDKKLFYCLRTEFKAHLAGQTYRVHGYPYMAQTTDVIVCAQAALWSVCRYLSERYSMYREVLPFDFVRYTERSHGRQYPYRGMTYTDYSDILSAFGTFPAILLFRKGNSKIQDQQDFRNLYSYVESGFPVLVHLRGVPQDHTVVVIGHTLDYRRRARRKVRTDPPGFIDSSEFVKQFVVVDDNYFPYQLLGYRNDPENYARKEGRYSIESIDGAVCPLPEKVFLPVEYARKRAFEWYYQKAKDIKKRLERLGGPPWVARLFLTTGVAFRKRKLAMSQEGEKQDWLNYWVTDLALPHFIWVMELSTLAQYRAGKCTAECVIDSTAGIDENCVIYSRIGKDLFFRDAWWSYPEQPDTFSQYMSNLGVPDEH
jgi:hypothetical protein